MKAPKANDYLTNEIEAVENGALAQVAALEAASIFALTVEKLEFSPDVNAEFQKNLKRCINALASSIPNQWKRQVLEYMLNTEEENDDAPSVNETGGEVTTVHAEPAATEPTE